MSFTTIDPSVADIYTAVNAHYSAAALSSSTISPTNSSSDSSTYASTVAHAFGYTLEELSSIPDNSNLGLSCGNPLALASLQPGEVVIDLGSGAGFDAFLASPRVGPSGKVIGIDVNPDMLALARANLVKALTGSTSKPGPDSVSTSTPPTWHNIQFVQSAITDMRAVVPDSTAHCIISNCVVNLVPHAEKPLVFREMYRVLKPGGQGRLAISDILLKEKELSNELKRDMGLYVGCIAGASRVAEYETWLREAGFGNVVIVDNGKDLNVYNSGDGNGGKSCCETTAPETATRSSCGAAVVKVDGALCDQRNGSSDLPEVGVDLAKVDFNEFAGSFNIYAVKM